MQYGNTKPTFDKDYLTILDDINNKCKSNIIYIKKMTCIQENCTLKIEDLNKSYSRDVGRRGGSYYRAYYSSSQK